MPCCCLSSKKWKDPFTSPPSGAVLLCIIAALLLVSALAAGLSLLASTTALTTVADNRQARAHYLALSGLNVWSAGRTGSFRLGGDSLALSQAGPDGDGTYSVTCRATVDAGSPLEAHAVLRAELPALAPISFAADLDDFTTPVVGKTENVAGAIVVYAADADGHAHPGDDANAAFENGAVALGNAGRSTGAIWYQGSRGACSGESCPDGMCRNGKCTLGKGLRAYFGFACLRVDSDGASTAYGDGFTFTIANAASNDPATAAGGMADGSRAEYLGYAGPGPSGLGIDAPKLAVEVDLYPNPGNNPPAMDNSRCDAGYANHVAVVYWGEAGCADDNRHGVGDFPANPGGPTAQNVGYVAVAETRGRANWLEDGRDHALRLEVQRRDTLGGGAYAVKVWVDGAGADFADVTVDYAGETPQIAYTTSMGAAEHRRLDTVFFGWTEGTGGSPQIVVIHDFSLEFRR